MRKFLGHYWYLLFAVIVIYTLILAPLPYRSHAQAAQGFTKIANVTTGTTYTDATCPDGTTCLYQVTAYNSAAESGPSNTISVTIPATGSHTVTLTWHAGTGGGVPTGYNVYQEQGPVPPAGLAGAVN